MSRPRRFLAIFDDNGEYVTRVPLTPAQFGALRPYLRDDADPEGTTAQDLGYLEIQLVTVVEG